MNQYSRLGINSILLWLITTSYCFSSDLWVDALHGNDQQDGQSAATALRTLNKAASLAQPGTTVHIQPGIYRESIKSPRSINSSPITYLAEQGSDTVIIRGSESADTLVWNPLTENDTGLPRTTPLNHVLWTDLSQWNLTTAPRFIVQLDDAGKVVTRFPLAREPDWQVSTEWKQHEYWWAAEGGSEVASCNPKVDKPRSSCDEASRSLTQLTDRQNDTQPEGIEAGNLTTLGNLSGATLVAIDTVQGHFVYRRTITTHEVESGRITVDRAVSYKAPERPGLGWGSKYYLENHPALLDQPGEYWFNPKTQRLYFWLPDSVDLKNIEISRQMLGWDLKNRSYTILDGLTFEFFNDAVIDQRNTSEQYSYHNQLRHLTLRYANRGIVAEQTLSATSPAEVMTTGFLLENSEISEMDSYAIRLNGAWDNNSSPASFIRAPITDSVFRNNTIHHIGFASEEERQGAVTFNFPDHLRFEDHHIYSTAYDGVQLYGTVIQSEQEYDFPPEQIKIGNILIKNNLIEKTCQLVEECGGIKVVGIPPKGHVFREVLVTGNTLHSNKGWSSIAEQRNLWNAGYFGFGFHLSDVSGIHLYRNLVYNNSWANLFLTQNWRDGEVVISNNTFANSLRGIDIWNNKDIVTHKSVSTQITNNILVNHEEFGITHTISLDESQVVIDYNLYYANGWGSGSKLGAMKALNVANGGQYPTVAEVRAATMWEAHGLEEDPSFKQYDYSAQALTQEGSDLDFRLNRHSPAVDRGTTLVSSLQNRLKRFAIVEPVLQQGTAWDIGAFEFSEKDLSIQGIAIDIATTQQLTTDAYFNSFVTSLLSGSGNHITIAAIDTVKVMIDIFPSPQDVGQPADLMIVATYTPAETQETFYFMRQGNAWLHWDGHISTLTTAEVVSSLAEQQEVLVYQGELATMLGNFVVYVGYLANGLLKFNGQQPLQFTVKDSK